MSSFKFCPECNNMLYPQENRAEKKLLLACRNCPYSEEAVSFLVNRHEVLHIPSEQTMVVTDLCTDPTLPQSHEVECEKCGGKNAVYFQSHSRHPDTKMTLYYVCCNSNCQYRWTSERQNELGENNTVGDAIDSGL